MHEKLAALHRLFKSAQPKGLSFEAASKNPKVSALINEILAAFGLPPTAEHVKILIKFGRAEDYSDATVNEVLIKLADAGAYYQTIMKLRDQSGYNVKVES